MNKYCVAIVMEEGQKDGKSYKLRQKVIECTSPYEALGMFTNDLKREFPNYSIMLYAITSLSE